MLEHVVTEGDWFALCVLAGFVSMTCGFLIVRLT